jgi:hypothetical protein
VALQAELHEVEVAVKAAMAESISLLELLDRAGVPYNETLDGSVARIREHLNTALAHL